MKKKPEYIYPIRHELLEKYADLINAEPALEQQTDAVKAEWCDQLKLMVLNPE